jgi:hypothetical protein
VDFTKEWLLRAAASIGANIRYKASTSSRGGNDWVWQSRRLHDRRALALQKAFAATFRSRSTRAREGKRQKWPKFREWLAKKMGLDSAIAIHLAERLAGPVK